MIEIRRLDASEAHAQLDGLAAVLADCVAGGASVSYLEPFSHDDARAAFEAVAAEVGRRSSATPRLRAERCTSSFAISLGWARVGVIPGYALHPDGRPCDTTVFWKAL
jgi:hypothetical protein